MSVSMRARPGSADRHHPTDGFVNIDALVEPQPKAALAYWQTKRGPRAMPAPRDIDPVEIPKLLPYLFLVDVLHEEPPDYFFRIEGEAVRGAVGFARRGQRLSQLREQYGAQYADSYAHYRTIAATKEPLAAVGRLTQLRRQFYRLEFAHLPLSHDGQRVDRILCCIGFVARPEDQGI